MKTILVLTDLSGNSLNAAEAGLTLAVELQAKLTLFHFCADVSVVPYYPGVCWVSPDQNWLKESEKQLKTLSGHLKNLGLRMYPAKGLPVIDFETEYGSLASGLSRIVKKNRAGLLVMGESAGSQMSHFMFGSDTDAVIDHCGKPVLIVPQKKPLRKLDKVTFATDFNKEDISVIEMLMRYGQKCQCQLDIVHVSLFEQHEKAPDQEILLFIKKLDKEQYPLVRFTEIRGKDLIRRLHGFCKDTETDILAFTHQQHSFFKRILKEGTVKRTISNQQFPVLILPSVNYL